MITKDNYALNRGELADCTICISAAQCILLRSVMSCAQVEIRIQMNRIHVENKTYCELAFPRPAGDG